MEHLGKASPSSDSHHCQITKYFILGDNCAYLLQQSIKILVKDLILNDSMFSLEGLGDVKES